MIEMEIVSVLFWKILNMFCIMLIGALLYKRRILTDVSTDDLGKILINLVIPAIVLSQMWTDYTADKEEALVRCFILGVLGEMVAICSAWIRFGRRQDAVSRGSTAFSNVGFFGIPVVTAVLGQQALFSLGPNLGTLNLLMSTLLVVWLSHSTKAVSLKNILLNPALLSLAAGLLLFFFRVPKPQFVDGLLGTISQLNTPVALLLSGAFLARSNILRALGKGKVWLVCIWRLVLIPAMIMVLYKFLPVGTPEEKKAIWISLACPVGMNLPVYAKLYDKKDVPLATEQVCISTLLCMITIPVGVMLLEKFLA